MTKKKAKGKKTAKKTKRRGTRKAASKELNPSAVRKDIAAKVKAEAGELAKAVIDEGKKGQLATVKYLFEMAHIFPEVLEENTLKEEESLAATLLNKLGIPEDPVIHDLYEKGEDIVIPPRPAVLESKREEKEELVKAE
jgi:hypothetical protein